MDYIFKGVIFMWLIIHGVINYVLSMRVRKEIKSLGVV